MNYKMVIKDLKERNEKLSQQYDFNRVHLITLENKNYRLEQQLKAYKDKEDKLREILNDYDADQVPSGLSQCTYEITVEEMQKIQQILNKGDK